MLLASMLMLYMSGWLFLRQNPAAWNATLYHSAERAISSGTALSLASIAFLAVFASCFRAHPLRPHRTHLALQRRDCVHAMSFQRRHLVTRPGASFAAGGDALSQAGSAIEQLVPRSPARRPAWSARRRSGRWRGSRI